MKKFIRKIEDFVCGHCGVKVKGAGYTNHCPRCFWSKHVDINPGDRQEICLGMMEPVGVELRGGKYIILHRCIKCGFEKKNKASKNDDFEVLLRLSGGF